MKPIIAKEGQKIIIGRQGENMASYVVFDPTLWIESLDMGQGTFELAVRRCGDDYFYPAVLRSDGRLLFWDITSADTAMVGDGSCELYYYVDEALAKDIIWDTYVMNSIGEPGEAPEPYESWTDEVLAARDRAETASDHYPYIDPTTYHWIAWDVSSDAWYDTGVLAQGQDGTPGADGADGFSPIVTITEGEGEHTLTIEDAEGEHSTVIKDGENGEDGYTPVRGVDYWTDADKAEIVSDTETALAPALADKVSISAQATKTEDMTEAVGIDDDGKLWVAPGGAVTDVQSPDGTSWLDGTVAKVPKGNSTLWGAYKPRPGYGLEGDANGAYTVRATDAQINGRSSLYGPIVPKNLDYAVKRAMTDGVGATWTDAEKAAARQRIGSEWHELSVSVGEDEDAPTALQITVPDEAQEIIVYGVIINKQERSSQNQIAIYAPTNPAAVLAKEALAAAGVNATMVRGDIVVDAIWMTDRWLGLWGGGGGSANVAPTNNTPRNGITSSGRNPASRNIVLYFAGRDLEVGSSLTVWWR